MVSPIFREQIYAGVDERLIETNCPVDFFNILYEIYPFAKQARVITATLEAGDCIYIPAYYFI